MRCKSLEFGGAKGLTYIIGDFFYHLKQNVMFTDTTPVNKVNRRKLMEGNNVAEIKKNNETGNWEVIFDGKTLMKTRELVWLKGNFKKSAKVAKLGISKAIIYDGNSTYTWNPFKNEQKKAKNMEKTINRNDNTDDLGFVEIEGMRMLKGLKKRARVVSRGTMTTILELEATDGSKF